MKISVVRKCNNYQGQIIVSEELEINRGILSTWLLNRVVIPDFNDINELKTFVSAVNLLVEPISGGIIGPVKFLYDDDFEILDDAKTLSFDLVDGSKIEVILKKFSPWDEDQPEGNMRLREALQEEKDELLEIEGYSSFYSEPDNNGKFQFSGIYVDALIPFLTEYHLREKKQDSLRWFDSNNTPIEVIEDIEEYWEFVA
jgi:hypothetical protein